MTLLQDTSHENKLRLLMILAAIYPEKFEGEKGLNIMKVGDWTAICSCSLSVILLSVLMMSLNHSVLILYFNFFQLAKLPPEDMNAVHTLRAMWGSSDTKKSSTRGFALKFDIHKVIALF